MSSLREIEVNSSLEVKKEDIFFQFISKFQVNEESVEIDLGILTKFVKDTCFKSVLQTIVSFSMNDLDNCIQATHDIQNFKTNIQKEMSKKGPVLQREDFDAERFRKLQSNFEEMNPGRLVKVCSLV